MRRTRWPGTLAIAIALVGAAACSSSKSATPAQRSTTSHVATTTTTDLAAKFNAAPKPSAGCADGGLVARAYAGNAFPIQGALRFDDYVGAHPLAERISPGRPLRVEQIPFAILSDTDDPDVSPPEDAQALRSVGAADIASAAWVGTAVDGVQNLVAIVACGHFAPDTIVRDAQSPHARSRASVSQSNGFTLLDWPNAVDPGTKAASLGVDDHVLIAGSSLGVVRTLIRHLAHPNRAGALHDLVMSAPAHHEFYVSVITHTQDLTFSDLAGHPFPSLPAPTRAQIAERVRALRKGGVMGRFAAISIGLRDVAGSPRVVVTYDYSTADAARRNAQVLRAMLASSTEIQGEATGQPMRTEFPGAAVTVDGHLVVATLRSSQPAAKVMQLPDDLLNSESRLLVWDDATTS